MTDPDMERARAIARSVLRMFCFTEEHDRAASASEKEVAWHIAPALNEAYERGQRDMRLKAQAAAFTAQLPSHYRWGHDAMEQFNFGKKRVREAIADLPITPEKEGGE